MSSLPTENANLPDYAPIPWSALGPPLNNRGYLSGPGGAEPLMIATVRGRFSDVAGTLIVPGDDFSLAQVEATVGVATIDTREPHRDHYLNFARRLHERERKRTPEGL